MKAFKIIKLSASLCCIIAAASGIAQGYIVVGEHGANGANVGEDSLVSRYANFSYWDNVVAMGAGAGVYLGTDGLTGYILTANHLGVMNSVDLVGQNYLLNRSQQIGTTDLRLYTIDFSGGFQAPALPNIGVLNRAPTLAETIVSIGRGSRVQGSDGNPNTNDMISLNGMSVYQWAGAGAMSWGENKVSTVPVWLGTGATATWTSTIGANESAFFATFDDPGAGQYGSSWESIAAAGDSGGPAFIYDQGEWVLAGITSTVLYRNNQPASTAAFGMRASYVNLSAYQSELPDFSASVGPVPEPSVSLLLLGASLGILTRRRRAEA